VFYFNIYLDIKSTIGTEYRFDLPGNENHLTSRTDIIFNITPKLLFMKYLLLLTVLLFTFTGNAQSDSTNSKTKLEETAIKVGTIIKKKYDGIYEYTPKVSFSMTATSYAGVQSLTLKSLSIKDVASGLTTKGLYLSTYSSDIKSSYYGYIDAEEISGLIKFLEFIIANKDNTEDAGTEYIYSCNDVQFAAFNMTFKKELQWVYQVKIDKYSSYSEVGLPIKNVEELLKALKDNMSKFE
jgi:hypothetical protein